MLVCSSCWIFLVFLFFWVLFVFVCLCLGIWCRILLFLVCNFVLFLYLGFGTLWVGIFLVFLLSVLGRFCIFVLCLFCVCFCLLVVLSMFRSVGRCYILGILNICLVLLLFFFFLCNFLCLVCFSLYCSWFRFPNVNGRVLWILLFWILFLVSLLVMFLFIHCRVLWLLFLNLSMVCF